MNNRSTLNRFTTVNLTTVGAARAYIDHLDCIGMLWHLEDDAADCFPCLSEEDCQVLNDAAEQIMRLDWAVLGYEDAFAYILTNLNN